jgi:hypothetical protein
MGKRKNEENPEIKEGQLKEPLREEFKDNNEDKNSVTSILSSINPLYSEDNNLDDMFKNNRNFYEEVSKKAFVTAFKEEEDRLNELVNATYHPTEKEEELTDFQLMKNHLNLI